MSHIRRKGAPISLLRLPTSQPNVQAQVSEVTSRMADLGISVYGLLENVHSIESSLAIANAGRAIKASVSHRLIRSNGIFDTSIDLSGKPTTAVLLTPEQAEIFFSEKIGVGPCYMVVVSATVAPDGPPTLVIVAAIPDGSPSRLDDPELVRRARTLADALHDDASARSVAFMRDAMHAIDGMHRLLLRKDRKSTPSSAEGIQTHTQSLALLIVRYVARMFRLHLCAILVPTDEDSTLWYHLASSERQAGIERAVVTRNQGLTGMVLSCPASNVIHTADIAGDTNFSPSSEAFLLPSAPADRSVCFLGVPIYATHTRNSDKPTAALMMIRPEAAVKRVTAFHADEIAVARHLAGVIAFALDASAAKIRLVREMSWYEQLSSIEQESLDDDAFYEQLLERFSQLLPSFSDATLLLSICDPVRAMITGAKVIGRATETLAVETKRPLWTVEPPAPTLEDSLSRLVRLHVTAPFRVSPQSDDPFACSLHPDATTRYLLKTEHLFIPLLGGNDTHSGAIIAVSDRVDDWRAEVSLTDIGRHAHFLGGIIARRIERSERERRSSVEAVLMSQLHEFSANPNSARPVMKQVLQRLCSRYEFTNAIIYRFDSHNRMLRGFVGHNVNDRQLLQTMYSTEGVTASSPRSPSLAVKVHLRRQPQFLPSIKDPVVDHDDRQKVGVADNVWVYAVPLLAGGNSEGVLIVCGENECRPDKPVPEFTTSFKKWLHGLCSTLGGMLVGLRNAESGEDERRVRISQATIVQQVEGLLSAERVGGRDDEEGMDSIAAFARRGKGQLDVIMDAAAHVFGAQVAGLFLAEQPATLPLSLSRDERLARGQFLPSHFHLVAGRGYKPFAYYSKTSAQKVSSGVARHLSYTPSERGLTAQVLRTLSARRSPDVVHDKRWSRKGEEFLDAKLLPLVDIESPSLLNEDTSGGLTGMARTWMGVPVLLDDGDARNLYGVLSFTRFRRSQKDRDSFSERDVAVARGIASLIAVLCQQRREVARIRRIVRGLLRTFQHEGMGDLLGGVSDVLHALSEETDETSVDAGHGRQRQCTDASDHLEFVQTVFEAFATYVSDEGTWDRTRSYRLESIVDPVVKVAQLSALRLGVSIRFELPPAETMVRIDRSKTRYILYAAVRNAVRSCYQRGGDGLGVVAAITVSQDRLVINVTDDGVGVNESDLQRLFVEGYSGFGGTGIGLAIIRKFIRLSNAPGAEGFCRFEPDIATGAKFVASIPLPRKGDLNED